MPPVTEEPREITPDAPTMKPTDETTTAEVSLEDLKEFGLEVGDEPAVEPDKAAEPTKPASAVPPAQPPAPAAEVPQPEEPAKGDIGKAMKEERGKRKAASASAKFWEEKALKIKAERDRALDQLNLRGRTVRLISDDDIKRIVEEADKADSIGKPIEKVVRLLNEKLQEHEVRLEQAFREREVARIEAQFKRDHPDYTETLRQAGIYEALTLDANGNWRDPVIGRTIFIEGADNPAEAAYFLAQALLGKGVERPDPDPEPTLPAGQNGHRAEGRPLEPAKPAEVAKPVEPVKPAEVIEAERRGARQVVERVASNVNRPRGVRVFSGSGGEPPRVTLNEEFRKYLDDMMERKPDQYLAFVRKNPDIDRWHMGG